MQPSSDAMSMSNEHQTFSDDLQSGLFRGAQLFPNGANEADCRSWKEANSTYADKLTHFQQTFAPILHFCFIPLTFSFRKHFMDVAIYLSYIQNCGRW